MHRPRLLLLVAASLVAAGCDHGSSASPAPVAPPPVVTAPVASSSPAGAGAPGGRIPYETMGWSPASRTLPQRTQTSLAVDPTDDDVVYVGVEQSGLFKTTDGGATWSRSSSGLLSRTSPSGPVFSEFYSTVIDPRDPQHLVLGLVGAPGTLQDWNSKKEGPYASRDGGRTWTQLVTSPSMNTSSYAVAIDPTDPDVLYAGVNGNRNIFSGALSNTVGVIYKSADAGRTWAELDTGFVEGMRCSSICIDPLDPRTVYAGVFVLHSNGGSDYDPRQLGLLRSTDGGATWSSRTSGMDTSNPSRVALQRIALSGRNPAHLFVSSFSLAYASIDRGETFRRVGRGISVFAFDPTDAAGERLTGFDPHEGSVCESADCGATWTVVGALPAESVASRTTVSQLTDLERSHQRSEVLYLSGAYGRVYRSGDRGATWTRILSGDALPP